MHAVGERKVFMGCDSRQKEWIEWRMIFCRKLQIDFVESLTVNFAETGRCLHPRDQHFDMARREAGENLVEFRMDDGGINPLQHVIGTEFQNDGIGTCRHAPIETGKAARSGISRNPGIDDADIEPIFAESLLKHGWKGLIGRQKIAGGEAVAQGDELQRRSGVCL